MKKDSGIEDLKEQVNDLGCLLRQLQLEKKNLNPKDRMQVCATDVITRTIKGIRKAYDSKSI